MVCFRFCCLVRFKFIIIESWMKTSNKQGSNLTNIIIESNSYNSLNKKLTLHNSQYSFTVVVVTYFYIPTQEMKKI